MGENPETVFVTGGPDIDLAAAIASDGALDFDPFERHGGVGDRLDLGDGYAVVLQHPVTTTWASAQEQVLPTLGALHELGIATLWFWPNVDAGSDGTSKGIRIFRETTKRANMHFFRTMPPEDFLKLLNNASVIVGNSSAAIRECSFLGVPAVDIGDRQTGRERGVNVVNVQHDRVAIITAVREQIAHGRYPSEHVYGDGNAGRRIAEVLATARLTIEKKLWY